MRGWGGIVLKVRPTELRKGARALGSEISTSLKYDDSTEHL
jgi:hypothetical protein